MATLAVATAFALPLAADNSPWGFSRAPVKAQVEPAPSLARQAFEVLLKAYRDNKVNTSVHRCIFDVSCSQFAEISFSKLGFLVGSVVFVDRYFYRENNGARGLYPLKGDENGVFHLDDGPFVP